MARQLNCDQCGEPATVIFEADVPDCTGYIDTLAFCNDCWPKIRLEIKRINGELQTQIEDSVKDTECPF